MFSDFFYALRTAGVPAGTGEYLDMLRALLGHAERRIPLTPERFYFLSRACLVKDEKHFHAFDRVFGQMFEGALSAEDPFKRFLEDWLREAKALERRAAEAPHFDPEELWRELEDRLKTQKERHDGGSRWVGTSGRSPFGHSGENPAGVRIGGEGLRRSAMDNTGGRYLEYSDQAKLGVRAYKIALRKLRNLRREGRLELDLEESLRRSGQSGEVEAVLRKSRKNRLTLLLLTDVGGSMTPYSLSVSRLFTAASKMQHFREFKHYYFHNAVYDSVFLDSVFRKPVSLEDLYKKYDAETRILFVGDACMNPYELFDKRHAFFEYYYKARARTDELSEKDVPSAFDRLRELTARYPHCAWLNPEPERAWWHETISAVAEVVPMFPLTIGGLTRAVKRLMLK